MGQSFIFPTAKILGADRLLRRASTAYPAISQTETGGILVQAAPGAVDIVLTSPPFQGSYVIDPAALAAGPVNLVPPVIAGTAAVGQTLVAKPGLWTHDGLLAAPVMTWQWLRAGTAIPGATGTEYVTASADAGKAITVIETAQDAHGTVQAVSAVLAMPAPPTTLVATQRAAATGLTAARIFAGLDLGTPSATRNIIVLAAAIGTAGASITSVKVGGVVATKLAQTLSGGTGIVCIGAYMAQVPAGTTGDVEMTTSANTTAQHVGLFRGEALKLADSITAAANGALVTMAVQAGRAGGKALAFAANNNGTAFNWTGGSELYDESIQSGKFVSAALGDVGPDGRASLSASRVTGTGQIAGLMIAL